MDLWFSFVDLSLTEPSLSYLQYLQNTLLKSVSLIQGVKNHCLGSFNDWPRYQERYNYSISRLPFKTEGAGVSLWVVESMVNFTPRERCEN